MLAKDETEMTKQRIAVPYYGALVRPKAGFERLFLVGDVCGADSKVEKLEVCLWDNQRRPNIAEWFQDNGITGLICSDANGGFEKTLNCEGIWVKTGIIGEACDLISEYASASI